MSLLSVFADSWHFKSWISNLRRDLCFFLQVVASSSHSHIHDCCCLPCKCRSYLPPASDPLVPVLWLRAVDQSKASMLRASVVVASKFRVLILSAMYGGRYARIMHRIGIPKFMRPIHPDLYPSVFCLICSVE